MKYCPLFYLFKTKTNTVPKAVKYLLFNPGITIFGLVFIPGNSLSFHFLCIVLFAWLAFFCLYEITYFINNTLSIKKEKTPTLTDVPSMENQSFTLFIAARLVYFGIISWLLFLISEYSLLEIMIVPLLILAISFLHNFTFSEWRIVPLSLMYLLKFNICFYLFDSFADIVSYNLVIFPGVLALILYYFLLKHFSNQFHQKMTKGVFITVTLILSSPVLFLPMIHPLSIHSLWFVLAVHVLGSLINSLQKVRIALFQNEIAYHIHTYFSFDSALSPEELVKAFKAFVHKDIYVTDHNDGLTPNRFLENKRKFNAVAGKSHQRFYYGIEYDINSGNHFLLCNLSMYKTISSFSDLALFKDKTDFIYWAHPGIYFLFKWSSLLSFFDIIRNIDGIEIVNLRPKRRFYSHIITFTIAFATSMLCINKSLILGFDVHTKEELNDVKKHLLMKSKIKPG